MPFRDPNNMPDLLSSGADLSDMEISACVEQDEYDDPSEMPGSEIDAIREQYEAEVQPFVRSLLELHERRTARERAS